MFKGSTERFPVCRSSDGCLEGREGCEVLDVSKKHDVIGFLYQPLLSLLKISALPPQAPNNSLLLLTDG